MRRRRMRRMYDEGEDVVMMMSRVYDEEEGEVMVMGKSRR